MRLRQKQTIPYGGGFFINRPELGIVGRGLLFHNLLDSVRAYRKANGLAIGLGFEEEVETAVCQQYPDECENVDSDRVYMRNLTSSDVVLGTRTMIALKASGGQLVSRDEAERRAAICAKCPNNVPFKKGCAGICGELKSLVDGIVGASGTTKDHALHSCLICACFLSASVWVPNEIQVPPLSEQQKSQFEVMEDTHQCWKHL